jgi:hypothetical protein
VDAEARAAARLRTALDLFDTGVRMRRVALKRELPHPSEAELDERIGAWLRERPGARTATVRSLPGGRVTLLSDILRLVVDEGSTCA